MGRRIQLLSEAIRPLFSVGRILRAMRAEDHVVAIERYLETFPEHSDHCRVLIEIGAGLTTASIARHARRLGAAAYSIDINEDLVREIDGSINAEGVIDFRIGDSAEVLRELVSEIDRVDFLFLDSAPSALRTWEEFQLVERLLGPGAVIVIDNACLPGELVRLSPCRKGKILVPYLLASPWWEVRAHPRSGDSMVVAIRSDTPDYGDMDYEGADWIDHWRQRVPGRQA